jgi:hypothetical protein
MAAITPSTELYLLKAPLEDDGRNTLTFASKTAQYNYFINLPKLNEDGLSSIDANPDFTYQRKDGIIRFPAHIDDLWGYNYVMYKNSNYGNKWFFAFISKMEYVNDNTTFITIKTDVFQTWQFDMNYKASFIEREHANTDVPGDNTIPEGLEIGEPIANGNTLSMPYTFQGDYYIAFQLSELTTELINNAPSGYGADQVYGGIFSGLWTICVPTYTSALTVIKHYSYKGKADAIVSCYYAAPLTATATGGAKTVSLPTSSGTSVNALIVYPDSYNDAKLIADERLPKPTSLNGYTPVNKKLLTYPYSYFIGTNNAGSTCVYHYEDFTTPDCRFQVVGALCQGMSIKCMPFYYKDLGNDMKSLNDYSLTAGKTPTCAWASDYYLNWVAQNSGAMQIQAGGSLATGAISAAASGNLLGFAGNALSTVFGVMAETERASKIPDQSKGNAAAGDINVSLGVDCFNFKGMCCRAGYALRIDNFFSMYGYKTNRVKIPNITGRRNWNYVKTIGFNFTGDMPQEDADEIRTLFDNGLTLWHNPSTYLDYSQANPIV